MPSPPDHVFGWFPLLMRSDVEQTSNQDSYYNCFAYAAGEDDAWWAPIRRTGVFWPRTAPLEHTLPAYMAAFASKGYVACENDDLEDGVEKIAIFVGEETGKPTHAARQLADGAWTSKLGEFEDVRHVLRQLEGPEPSYGRVAAFMKRRRA